MFRIGLLLLISSLVLSGCARVKENAPPAAQEKADTQTQDSNIWDFGKVKEGTVSRHTFIFRNDTKKPLKIKEVSSSCGCTVSSVQKKELAPAESTAIDVDFKSKGYSGPIQQFIYVNTDSVDNPIVRFIIKGEVVK